MPDSEEGKQDKAIESQPRRKDEIVWTHDEDGREKDSKEESEGAASKRRVEESAEGRMVEEQTEMKVSPSELESILLTHPAVKDVAVVGIPEPVFGELPLAYIVKQPGVSVKEEEIHKFLNVPKSTIQNCLVKCGHVKNDQGSNVTEVDGSSEYDSTQDED
uniref:AMP-binding enzyme C-terminal domain-containing protein n=1 Tax=Timema poppense TaxID=170557 RepID=A0A7R9GXV5_TIMPO|nr:unnamed protein product [Timema poppensis]